MDKPRETTTTPNPSSLQSYNLRFLATVCSNVATEKPGTKIQLTTTTSGQNCNKPWNCEMSIDQFEKLYNTLNAAKNDNVTKNK